MKKLNTLLAGLLLVAMTVTGQTYLSHDNGFKSSYFSSERAFVSAIDVSGNLLFTSTVDTIRVLDMMKGKTLRQYVKPADDKASIYASFLTVSPGGQFLWAGYTSADNMDDRIYCIDLESGLWDLKARFPKNFELAYWNDSLLVSGINSASPEDPNGIFLLDTTGQDLHRILIETGGYSSGLAIDSTGNIYYGTSLMTDPNALCMWDSSLVAKIMGIPLADTLSLADARKLSDLPAGAYDCDLDKSGNLVLNLNQFMGKKVVAKWNGIAGNGINLDTLAYTSGDWDWMAIIKTRGDITVPESGNGIVTFSFNRDLVDIHSADYPPFVAHPLPDLLLTRSGRDTIMDISTLFSDHDDADSAIIKAVVYNSLDALETSVSGDSLTLSPQVFITDGTGSITAELVIEGISSGLAVRDTFRVTIELPSGMEVLPPDRLVVYPNPGSGIFMVNAPGMEEVGIKIYSLTGSLVKEVDHYSPGVEIRMDDQPEGIYILRVPLAGSVVSRLIQKQ